jgi:hypothetical protein
VLPVIILLTAGFDAAGLLIEGVGVLATAADGGFGLEIRLRSQLLKAPKAVFVLAGITPAPVGPT